MLTFYQETLSQRHYHFFLLIISLSLKSSLLPPIMDLQHKFPQESYNNLWTHKVGIVKEDKLYKIGTYGGVITKHHELKLIS